MSERVITFELKHDDCGEFQPSWTGTGFVDDKPFECALIYRYGDNCHFGWCFTEDCTKDLSREQCEAVAEYLSDEISKIQDLEAAERKQRNRLRRLGKL